MSTLKITRKFTTTCNCELREIVSFEKIVEKHKKSEDKEIVDTMGK